MDRAALKELLGRVQAAKRADRDIDQAIYGLLDDVCISDGYRCLYRAPAYTSSLDACVALIRKAIPEANCYGFDVEPSYVHGYVSLNNVPAGHWYCGADHSDPALALLAALLKALILIEERKATPTPSPAEHPEGGGL